MTKLVTSTMLLIGLRPIGFQPILQPQRRRLDGHVLENQRGVARAKGVIFDIVTVICGSSRRESRGFTGSSSFLPVIAATSRAMP